MVMPLFATFYFFLILSNFGFPGTVNFVGEFLIILGALFFSDTLIFFSSFMMILTLIYSLFTYNKLFFGPFASYFIKFYTDVIRLEFFVLGVFVFLVIIIGCYPNFVLNFSFLGILRLNLFYF
jgi:NADH:ubiquinone oxidoreductase subunit 4 (subunit M)